MAMSKKMKTVLTIAGLVVLTAVVGYVIYYFATKNSGNNNNDESLETEPQNNSSNTPHSDGVTTPTSTLGSSMTNSTILKWKKPLMQGAQVKWMQHAYNLLAYKYNTVTRPATPWVGLKEDGIFGEATHNALPKIMGSGIHEASWAAFKPKVEAKYNALFPNATVDLWGNPKTSTGTSAFNPVFYANSPIINL